MTAEELARIAGVQESTLRKTVRELREMLNRDAEENEHIWEMVTA